MESYPTPHALVEALHARQGRARRQLHQLLLASGALAGYQSGEQKSSSDLNYGVT
jgi:hypothetical protein